jgi:hypothetical protein
MNHWKDRAKESFKARRSPDTLVEIPVPEWGISVWYWPDMTLQERREIYLLAKQEDGQTILDLEAMAVSLIVRARDSAGKKLFAMPEKRELMTEYDPDVISRVVGSMASGGLTVEDAEKN